MWETDSDGMAASLALHDQVMRKVIDQHRGHVFSTAGDAFAAAFQSADAAVNAAPVIQLQLFDADWPGPGIKIRMGIHTGSAEERDGDYFGPVLNRAARIMSAGPGGRFSCHRWLQMQRISKATCLSETWGHTTSGISMSPSISTRFDIPIFRRPTGR